MADVIPGSVGAEAPTVPGSPGAKSMEQAYAEAGAAVQPQEQAPQAQVEQPEVQPDQAPDTSTDEGKFDVAEWKKSLPTDVAKNVDRVITSIRQKDSETLTALQEKTQRLAWAEDLNRLVASENPADRARATALLKATLNTLEQLTPQPEPDPLAGVDFESVEAIAPGLGKLVQVQQQHIAALQSQLGQVAGSAQTLEATRADETLDREIKAVETYAKENNLPWDEKAVLATADRLNLEDVRAAYFAHYGPQLTEAGKQAALKSIQTKQRASLPGGGPAVGTPQRPKSDSMMDHWNHAKTEVGVSGSVFDK